MNELKFSNKEEQMVAWSLVSPSYTLSGNNTQSNQIDHGSQRQLITGIGSYYFCSLQ